MEKKKYQDLPPGFYLDLEVALYTMAQTGKTGGRRGLVEARAGGGGGGRQGWVGGRGGIWKTRGRIKSSL